MVDDRVLDYQHALTELEGDEEIYQEVLEIYLEDTPDIIERIQQAYSTGDSDSLSIEAHSLKSSSRIIGGIRLSDIAAKLEADSKDGNLGNAPTLITQIKEGFEALLGVIKADKVLK
jgi:HPt (histidine-containing phosphotransfer) domain-containing protein